MAGQTNRLFYLTIILSITIVTINFIGHDFSFVNKEKVMITSLANESIQDKYNFTNPLGSIFNYLCFDLFFFGILLFSLIFILLQFLHIKEIAYLHYVGYLLSILVYYIRNWSFGYKDGVIGFYMMKTIHHGETVLSAAIMILYVIFIRSFLDGIKNFYFTQITNLIINSSLIFGGVGLIYGLIWDKDWVLLEVIYKIVLIPLAGIIVVNLFNSTKRILALYIIWGSMFLFIGALITGFIGFYNLSYSTGYVLGNSKLFYYKAGIVLEILCFATGLGYKSKLVLQEKNAAQQSLIQQLEANHTLQSELNQKLSLEKEKLDIENQLTLVELRLLKAQINPHFLFNSFNALKDLIHHNKNGEAIQYLGKFTRMMRGVLSSSEIQQHSLKEELAFCENYVALESVRFAKDLSLSLEASEESLGILVPTMILQPILENAIWHGLLPKTGDRNINIRSQINDQKLLIQVIDNGLGLKYSEVNSFKEDRYTSFGLKLLVDRLKYFSKDSTLNISDRSDLDANITGTIVSIEIPILLYTPSDLMPQSSNLYSS